LQCVAVCCSVLQCVAVCCSVLQCVAVCCSVLQRGVVCCSVLQCVAVCCSEKQLQWSVGNLVPTHTHQHVTHKSLSRIIYECICIIPRSYKHSYNTHTIESNRSQHTYELVVSQVLLCHGTCMNVSCHTYV